MSYNLNKCTTLGIVQLSLSTTPIKELSFYKEHRRLKCFLYKGTKCVNCGIIGTQLMVNDVRSSIHIDIFTSDNKFMTIDHIIPCSKGGSREDINNLQPMCSKCNSLKGNT